LCDATELARTGRRIRVFLVQDGVLAAVPGAVAELGGLLDAGAELWVDRFSWRQRGLSSADLCPGATLADMAKVAERVLDPAVQVVWR
jgi:hypothetical protein